ncbi:MAG: DUF2130 domain-containing protein [Planctomycetes bacterium]|nr:DUF2130 domain-containing protein [Planctomycetota bacterium]
MNNKVTCPQCRTEFPIDQVLSAQLDAEIRGELQAEYSEKTRKLAEDRDQLAQRRKQLDAQQEQVDQQVREEVAKERATILAKARVEAQQAVAIEIKDRDDQLKGAAEKIEAFQEQELQLRQKKRELEEQAEKQELETERWKDAERKKIREATLKQAEEQNQLKLAESEHRIGSLRKQIDELKRKIEQGSQQTQGEVLEIALENLLTEQFPSDVIKPVAKGVKGGDVIQHVFDGNGRECGSILWETKRTKSWNDKWLSKAIDDQQEAKTSCACIVSSALPESIPYFGEISGVWIASWPCARSAAMALRRVLIESSQARLATEGQHGKMEHVYNYLSGHEFRNRIRGLVEPYIEMQADLESEKRAFNKHWNKRQKQLDRAISSTTGLFGDLQGIIGNELQEIEGMDLLALEVTESSDPTPEPAG